MRARISGMRDVFAHEYGEIDDGVLWLARTTENSTLIPVLGLLVDEAKGGCGAVGEPPRAARRSLLHSSKAGNSRTWIVLMTVLGAGLKCGDAGSDTGIITSAGADLSDEQRSKAITSARSGLFCCRSLLTSLRVWQVSDSGWAWLRYEPLALRAFQ